MNTAALAWNSGGMSDDSLRPGFLGVRRQLLTLLGNTTVVLVLLTAGYYVLPLRLNVSDGGVLVHLVVGLALVGAVAVVFRLHARRSRQSLSKEMYQIQWLLSVLYLLVLVFAMTYAVTASLDPKQFVGIGDRTAALYFSVTVVGTVGFGDLHAADTLGQLLVTAQMLFDLIYLGTALRLLSGLAVRGGAEG